MSKTKTQITEHRKEHDIENIEKKIKGKIEYSPKDTTEIRKNCPEDAESQAAAGSGRTPQERTQGQEGKELPLMREDERKERAGRALRAAFPHTLPVLTGFAFLGLVYGMLMESKGYGAFWSLLMSAAAFCGSMQYVAVTLLTVVFNPVQALLMSLMVNARHLFYGISMLEKYKGMGRIKPFLIYVLCDETYSIASSVEIPEGVSGKWFYFWISLLDYSYWVTASFLGGLLGGVLQIRLEGLDFALTALFVVIFLNQWKDQSKRKPALIGVGCSVLCVVLFGADGFIIPAMAVIAAALLCGRGSLAGQAGEEGSAS